jgi:hypothetical protein
MNKIYLQSLFPELTDEKFEKKRKEAVEELLEWLWAYATFAGVFSEKSLQQIEEMDVEFASKLIKLSNHGNFDLIEHLARFGKKYKTKSMFIDKTAVEEVVDLLKTKAVTQT